MKEIKNFINEAVNGNDPISIIAFSITEFINSHENLEGDDLAKEMKFIRTYLSNIQHDLHIRFDKLEKQLKISKAYNDPKTNIEQWILSKIAKKPNK